MRPAVKRTVWVLGGVCVFIVALGGAVWLAGNSDPGRRFIERVTSRLTGGQVVLTGLAGSFPTRPTLEHLELRDSHGVWLTADGIRLRWSPLALLEWRIKVDELFAVRAHMERTPISDHPGGSTTIPHIEVGHFVLDAAELGAPLVGTATVLSASGTLQLPSLENLEVGLAAHRQNGDGDYRLNLRLDSKRLDASLAIHEPAGGPLENLLSLPGLGALSASATVAGPRHAERVDATLQAGTLHGELHGSVDLKHAAAELDYSLDTADMAPRPGVDWRRLALMGNWHGSMSAPRAEGKLTVDDLRLSPTTRVARLSADLAASGGALDVRSTLSGLTIPGPQPQVFAGAPLEINGSLRLDQPARPLDLSATHPLFHLRLHADSTDLTAKTLRAAVDLAIPEIAPLAAFAAQDARGSATLHADLTHAQGADAVQLRAKLELSGGTAAWAGALGPHAELTVSGNLSDTSIAISNLRVAGEALTLTASGSAERPAAGATGITAASGASGAPGAAGITGAPRATSATGASGTTGITGAPGFIKDFQARWQLDVADLSRLSPDLGGELKMSGQIGGSPASMAADADLESRLSVRGSAAGDLQARVHVGGLPQAPSGTIEAQGMLDGAPLNLNAAVDRMADEALRITIRQADWKSAHAEGEMTSNAELGQSHGQLSLRVAQLTDFDRLLGTNLAGSVDGTLGFVPSSGQTQVHLQMAAKNAAIGPLSGDLQLEATGVPAALALQLNAQLPALYGAPGALAAAGILNLQARELRLSSISADYRSQNIRLLSPALLSFARGLSIDELRFGAGAAIFQVAGEFTPTLDARASLTQVTPALVNGFAPGLLAAGTLEAQARLQGDFSSPTGSVRIAVTGLQFADDAATGLPATDVSGHAEIANGSASINVTLTAGAGSELTASGTAPLDAQGPLDLKIGGKLNVGLANPVLEARGLHGAGALTVDAAVTGNRAAPQVSGSITLAAGSVRDYAHGVNLTDINAQVVGNEGGLQIKSFDARAASGHVSMTGTFGILQHGLPVDLKITAKNAQPIASSIITANLDADLHVSGTALERLDIGGTVHVNRATIGLPDSLPPDVAVLDVRRRGQTAPAASGSPLVVGFNVAILAPQQILVEGRGLNAELGGDIKLGGTAAEPLVSGGFDLQRGSFTIAGSKLELTPPGRVGFDGEGLRKKIDPTLDFTAQSTVTPSAGAATTVVLRISGLADAPQFEFNTIPPGQLQPDEIMSLLLFGQPASQLSALQVAEIGAALATLSGVGGSGANPLIKLQKSLGLDRLTVGSNTTTSATGTPENSGAAIAAGRYVSKRVYIEAKQSTTGTSQVQVDVDLTKHLKLQTRLGNGTAAVQGTTPENDPGSSVGLSYQFEY